MKAIQPVHLHDKGAEASNLHEGLLFLIRKQGGISENDRETLERRLAPEVRLQTFGDVTAELVGIWQNQLKSRPGLPQKLKNKVMNLPVSTTTGRGNGDVDEVTAEALNWLLKKLGARPE